MENDNKENGVKMDKKSQMKRYYVDFYDMFDGWGEFGFFIDRLFDELSDATKLCDKLNEELDNGNKACGEHYGVIYGMTNREVYCGLDEKYETKISDLKEHLTELKVSNVPKEIKKCEKVIKPLSKDRYEEVTEEIVHLINDDLLNSTGFDAVQIGNILRRRLGTGFLEECDRRTGEDIMKVKIPGTNFDLRVDMPPEEIEMVTHSADCRYCNGIVKMMRDRETFKLQPDNCPCLMCGQRYFVKILDTIEEWELKQWIQKGQTFAMGGDLSEEGKAVLDAESSENISNE